MLAAWGLTVCLAGAWPPARADVTAEELSRPENMPDDPDYRPGPGCAGQHALYGFTPACLLALDPGERALGVGVAADRAWALTRGAPGVLIAVVGDGADWSSVELVSRWRLSPGELPAPDVPGGGGHDRNGDGAFTVQDYTSATGTVAPTVDRVVDRGLLARADRGDVNTNGLLDPGDLIRLFADGVDGDANGYADDIAGYDFLDGDPDPGEPRTDPVALAAAAEANNALGGAGVCPRCTLLPIRASLAGLARGNELGAAVAYAAEHEVQVLALATSAAAGGNFLRAATRYAEERGASVVAHAGAGGGERLDLPLPPDSALFASTLGYDAERAAARTAFARDACSNHLPKADLGVPGRCADEPLGVLAGALGLAHAVMRGLPALNLPPLAPPLGPRELALLFRTSATPAPARRGTSARLDVRRMLDQLVERRLPIELELFAPEWGAMLDPTPAGGVVIRAQVNNRRALRAAWALEAAPGRDPAPLSYRPLSTGTVDPGQLQEISATLEIAGLFRDPTSAPVRAGDFELSLRLTATTDEPASAKSELLRPALVHRDLELWPAFPRFLGAGAVGAPRLVDLDQDGDEEVLVATDDGRLHAIDAAGRELPGFPASAAPWPPAAPGGRYAQAPAYQSGALGGEPFDPFDTEVLVGDGAPPLLAAAAVHGQLHFFDAAGAPLGARSLPGRLASAPVLVDLDLDGREELVVATADARLWAVRSDGGDLPPFPLALPEAPSALAVGDLDRDGAPDVVALGPRVLAAVDAAGSALPGFPAALPPLPGPSARGADALAARSVALGDVDGDGGLEVLVAARGAEPLLFGASGALRSPLAVTRAQRGAASDAPAAGAAWIASGGLTAIADLDGDRRPDLITGLESTSAGGREWLIGAWSAPEGAFLDPAPRILPEPARALLVADLDGDQRPELILGRGPDRLEALSLDGTRPRGWPKLVTGVLLGAPAIGDLDGDGKRDVAVVTRTGDLFAWRTPASHAALAPWPTAGHDRRGTHNAETPGAVLKKERLDSGCGCTAGRGRATGLRAPLAPWLLALLAFALRTRAGAACTGPGDAAERSRWPSSGTRLD